MKQIVKIPILTAVLVGLPALGIICFDQDLTIYLEFPPVTQFIVKAGFSITAFIFFSVLIALTVVPLGYQCFKAYRNSAESPAKQQFPWWGYLGLLLLLFFWIVAWNRFTWAAFIQEHTFFPLWFSYIIVINALAQRKRGHCLITREPKYFILLFLGSACFWWFFEYLNRFVQNWDYSGTQYSSLKYFLLASLAFSTVLPAVLSTMEYLLGYKWLNETFRITFPFTITRPKRVAFGALLLSMSSLFLIGIYPDYLFPFLWVSPLIVIISLNTIFGETHVLYLKSVDNQRKVLAAMLAALICGFFWEMWNYWSLIQWHYEIPLVNRYHLFEMPILGYSGYLPFGIECLVIGDSLRSMLTRR